MRQAPQRTLSASRWPWRPVGGFALAAAASAGQCRDAPARAGRGRRPGRSPPFQHRQHRDAFRAARIRRRAGDDLASQRFRRAVGVPLPDAGQRFRRRRRYRLLVLRHDRARRRRQAGRRRRLPHGADGRRARQGHQERNGRSTPKGSRQGRRRHGRLRARPSHRAVQDRAGRHEGGVRATSIS